MPPLLFCSLLPLPPPPPTSSPPPIQALHIDSDAAGLRAIWHALVFESPPGMQLGLALRLYERMASGMGAPCPANDRTAILTTISANGTVGLLACKKE